MAIIIRNDYTTEDLTRLNKELECIEHKIEKTKCAEDSITYENIPIGYGYVLEGRIYNILNLYRVLIKKPKDPYSNEVISADILKDITRKIKDIILKNKDTLMVGSIYKNKDKAISEKSLSKESQKKGGKRKKDKKSKTRVVVVRERQNISKQSKARQADTRQFRRVTTT